MTDYDALVIEARNFPAARSLGHPGIRLIGRLANAVADLAVAPTQIETVEQLDALPANTIVLGGTPGDPFVARKGYGLNARDWSVLDWQEGGYQPEYLVGAECLPVVVVQMGLPS